MLTCKVSVRRYRPGDEAALLARGLRAADAREAFKVVGTGPAAALAHTLAGSAMTAAIEINGSVAALFGLCPQGLLCSAAAPWLLAHDDFDRPEAALALGRISRRFIDHWHAVFGRLENLADPEHVKAIRYLEWLGFSFAWEAPLRGPFGHELIPFWRQPCALHRPLFC